MSATRAIFMTKCQVKVHCKFQACPAPMISVRQVLVQETNYFKLLLYHSSEKRCSSKINLSEIITNIPTPDCAFPDICPLARCIVLYGKTICPSRGICTSLNHQGVGK